MDPWSLDALPASAEGRFSSAWHVGQTNTVCLLCAARSPTPHLPPSTHTHTSYLCAKLHSQYTPTFPVLCTMIMKLKLLVFSSSLSFFFIIRKQGQLRVGVVDSGFKGCRFDSWPEWQENVLLHSQLSVLTLVLICSTPFTTVACKRSWSFCQKC